MMELKVMQLGNLAANCYICYDKDAGEAVIIDPGDEGHKVIAFLEEQQLIPKAILLTHSHYDHTGGVLEIHEKYGAPIAVHESEQELLIDGMKNMSAAYGRKAIVMSPDVMLKDGETYTPFSDGTSFLVLHTPGHTQGGASFFFKPLHAVFTGDTLFCRSVGRSDFFSGSHDALMASIKDKLMRLEDTVTVYPGHGMKTTIGDERQSNPFLK